MEDNEELTPEERVTRIYHENLAKGNAAKWDALGVWVMGGFFGLIILFLFILLMGFGKWIWNL